MARWWDRLLGRGGDATAVALPPQHDLDVFCRRFGCTYERTRDTLYDGTPGTVQVTLIRGDERIAGRGATTREAVATATRRASKAWSES